MAEAHSLGGVSEDEIRAIAHESGGPPGDAGASPLTRFARKLAGLVRLRSEKGENGVAIFLKSDALAEDLGGRKSKEVPLLANGNDVVSNRIWVAGAGLGTAYALESEASEIGDMYQWIRDAGLGRLPAFVADFRGERPSARLHQDGVELKTVDNYLAIDFKEEPIASEEMKAALDHFHLKSLRTPALIVEGHAQRIWKKSTHGWPESRPEERIHGRLMDTLRARFTRHSVRAEVHSDEGRVDIVVWTKTPDGAGHASMRNDWVLELKALADRTTTGKPVPKRTCEKSVEDGVTQAISYRASITALRAALCCYDMREKDRGDAECFKRVSRRAAREKIELWRWFLFRSAAKARAAA